MEEEKRAREIRRAGTLLLWSSAISLVGSVVGITLMYTAGQLYAPWTNYVSDMSIGAGGGSVVYVFLMIGVAMVNLAFFVIGSGPVQRALGVTPFLVHAIQAVGVSCSIDMFLTACFPLDPDRPNVYRIHVVGGFVFSVTTAVWLSHYGWIFFRGGTKLLRLSSMFGLVGSLLWGLFGGLLLFTELLEGAMVQYKRARAIYLLQWTAFGCISQDVCSQPRSKAKESMNVIESTKKPKNKVVSSIRQVMVATRFDFVFFICRHLYTFLNLTLLTCWSPFLASARGPTCGKSPKEGHRHPMHSVYRNDCRLYTVPKAESQHP